jgi:hypothetical protein
MFQWTEASVSCSNLSAAVTYEHSDSTSSPTHLQLMGGGGELGEPGKYNPDISRPTALQDPGAGAASPRTPLPGVPSPVPHTTKSYNKLLTLSPSQGPASASSMPLALDTSIADATTGHR